MTIARRLRTFGSWDAARRGLVLEAALLLTRASLTIRFAPFRIAVRSGSRALSTRRASEPIEQLRWAVDLASRNLPWRIVCFQRGLAMQAMLRRRGVDACLHYGVGHDAAGELVAHVWVSDGDHIVIGEDEAGHHRTVAVFP